MCDSEMKSTECPICNKNFPLNKIEQHVNTCLFLNSKENVPHSKRKRTPSPESKLNAQKSPKFTFKSSPKSSKLANIFVRPKDEVPSTSVKPNNEQKLKEKTECDLNFMVPLAKQVVPKTLNDFLGQQHILGDESVLKNLLEKQEIPNMILWGPPGCGKTSLATVIQEICKANSTKFKFVSLCATNCGVKDVQNIVSSAKLESKFKKRTILFMDEVHRFNKKQQDTFLPHVEKGEIILIGATTENPSFTINNALLSRCRVIVFQKLTDEDLLTILINAARRFNVQVIQGGFDDRGVLDTVCIEKTALKWLADVSDGDARIALTNLQLVLQNNRDKKTIINVEDIKEGIQKSHLLYDRKGEEHYNIISAMHKSIRGSDADAALYWTTRMIVSGEDPMFIARRMVRAASEDIGNADPNALQLAISTMQGCHLLGMPECDVLLAQCAIYLARAPKSREADSALAEAKRVISECRGSQPEVPMHIRNAPTKLMKDLGYGKLKPGEIPSFMPKGLEDVSFF
ncbi:ATPase WRNIP1-like [Onthophagus taurus]|uniref:ATPase WRNIP1-like n=1 Tax=Onthophagus taurus TaxID=166361 RepID=UPI000C204583|nr:ATPase WRNIP1-like [Onthophagus taurus]